MSLQYRLRRHDFDSQSQNSIRGLKPLDHPLSRQHGRIFTGICLTAAAFQRCQGFFVIRMSEKLYQPLSVFILEQAVDQVQNLLQRSTARRSGHHLWFEHSAVKPRDDASTLSRRWSRIGACRLHCHCQSESVTLTADRVSLPDTRPRADG